MRINSPPANSDFIMKMLVGSHKATSLVLLYICMELTYDYEAGKRPAPVREVRSKKWLLHVMCPRSTKHFISKKFDTRGAFSLNIVAPRSLRDIAEPLSMPGTLDSENYADTLLQPLGVDWV